jgi:NAD+ diphosphatase
MSEARFRHGNYYSGSGLDRVSHLREDTAWLAARLEDPRSRIVPVWRAQNLFRAGPAEGAPGALLPSLGELREPLDGAADLVLLGTIEEVAHFALDLSHIEDAAAASALFEGGEFADLRRHGALLERREGAILAYARGILHWHSRHRFCGSCGAPTASAQAGHVRLCTGPSCGMQHFPRTDPAVIMLVTHGEYCLLGRQKVWAPGMHSTLAGFVEPGESLEEAVAREVLEEAGVRVPVEAVRYHSSQPWPFPASIMLGFHAEAPSLALAVNRSELEDARWFSREALLASPENESFRLPRRDSIARRLIESWLGRE